MITVQREPFATMMEELKPLSQRHWREVAHYDDIALNPDYDFYCKSPVLRCVSVRNEGALVGYAIFGVGRNKHYMDSVQAVQDVLFVDPSDRGGVGRMLVRECDRQLKEEGVQVVYHHQKLAHQALGHLLRSEGYEPVEVIWAKRLDKE
jgi:predicted N-acetyltransferase YhbS